MVAGPVNHFWKLGRWPVWLPQRKFRLEVTETKPPGHVSPEGLHPILQKKRLVYAAAPAALLLGLFGCGEVTRAPAKSSTAGSEGGAASGEASNGGAGAVVDVGDPLPRPLSVSAAAGEHLHEVSGGHVGLDNRVPKLLGKLIVNVSSGNGVSGLYEFGLRRGFHVYAANVSTEVCSAFDDQNSFRAGDYLGDCRLELLDGQDHSPAIAVGPTESVAQNLARDLAELAQQFPEEDWGYFLDEGGRVRWSDVGFVGYDAGDGGTTVARWAKTMRLYRVVSLSGPRDNDCSDHAPHDGETFDPSRPPYDAKCPSARIAAWLDEPSLTPAERYYAFAGSANTPDYGNILFALERLGYAGEPTDVLATAVPYAGSHRFYAAEANSDFSDAKYWPAFGVAWGVPSENMAFAAAAAAAK